MLRAVDQPVNTCGRETSRPWAGFQPSAPTKAENPGFRHIRRHGDWGHEGQLYWLQGLCGGGINLFVDSHGHEDRIRKGSRRMSSIQKRVANGHQTYEPVSRHVGSMGVWATGESVSPRLVGQRRVAKVLSRLSSANSQDVGAAGSRSASGRGRLRDPTHSSSVACVPGLGESDERCRRVWPSDVCGFHAWFQSEH
jgi:hypothetical protein